MYDVVHKLVLAVILSIGKWIYRNGFIEGLKVNIMVFSVLNFRLRFPSYGLA